MELLENIKMELPKMSRFWYKIGLPKLQALLFANQSCSVVSQNMK
jgi:hypothetical protein